MATAAGLDEEKTKDYLGVDYDPEVVELAPLDAWKRKWPRWEAVLQKEIADRRDRAKSPRWETRQNTSVLRQQARNWTARVAKVATGILESFDSVNKPDYDGHGGNLPSASRLPAHVLATPAALAASDLETFRQAMTQKAWFEETTRLWENSWAEGFQLAYRLARFNPPPFLYGWLSLLRSSDAERASEQWLDSNAPFARVNCRLGLECVFVYDRLLEQPGLFETNCYIVFLGELTNGVGAAKLYLPEVMADVAGDHAAMRIQLDPYNESISNATRFVQFMLNYMAFLDGAAGFLGRGIHDDDDDDDDDDGEWKPDPKRPRLPAEPATELPPATRSSPMTGQSGSFRKP